MSGAPAIADKKCFSVDFGKMYWKQVSHQVPNDLGPEHSISSPKGWPDVALPLGDKFQRVGVSVDAGAIAEPILLGD